MMEVRVLCLLAMPEATQYGWREGVHKGGKNLFRIERLMQPRPELVELRPRHRVDLPRGVGPRLLAVSAAQVVGGPNAPLLTESSSATARLASILPPTLGRVGKEANDVIIEALREEIGSAQERVGRLALGAGGLEAVQRGREQRAPLG